MKALAAGLALCYAAFACAEPAALPMDRDVVFNVGDILTYDDNIFRIPPPNTPGVIYPGPGSSKADEINSASLGVKANWNFGLQSVVANVYAADNVYLKNTELDNISGSAKAEWDWRVADVLSGRLGADYSRYLADFANTEIYSKDVIADTDYYAHGVWDLGPHWRAYVDARGEVATHTDAVREGEDYESGSGSLGLEYALSPDNSIGTEYRFTHLLFRQGQSVAGALAYRDYDDNALSLYLKYALTAVTSLDMGAGYVNRSYNADSTLVAAGSGNFTGDVWHVTLNWLPTQQTGIKVKVWRDLRAYVDAESNYFISRGVGIGPYWSPLDRLTITFDLARESQQYIGNDLDIGSLPQRKDTLSTGKLKVEYRIRRRFEVDAGYNYERRTSDEPSVVYKDDLATVSLRYSF